MNTTEGSKTVSTYTKEYTTTVCALEEGDWIEKIPTQNGVRGVKVESSVQSLGAGYGWTTSTGRGRRRTDVESTIIGTRRGNFHVPSDFTVVIRREVSA